MISIKNYIMEQEINTASCDDIELARCFAEMEVVSSLIDCYIKQETIMEYSTTDISEFGIFTEGSTLAEEIDAEMGAAVDKALGTGESKGGKIKNVLKTGWEAVIKFFKQIGQMIVKLFSRVKYIDLIKIVENSPTAKWRYSKFLMKCSAEMGFLIEEYNRFGDLIADRSSDLAEYEKVLDAVQKVEKRIKDAVPSKENDASDIVEYTQAEMIDILKNLDQLQRNGIPSVRKTLKKFDVAKSDFLPPDRKEVYQTVRKCAASLNASFTALNKTVMAATTKIIKITDKKQRAAVEYVCDFGCDSDDIVQEMTLVEQMGFALAGSVISAAASVIARIAIAKKLKNAPDQLLTAIDDAMTIVEGGEEKIIRNLSEFNNALKRIKKNLEFSKMSIATMTVRENKELNEIAKDLNDYIDAVLVMTNAIFAKRNLKKNTYRLGDRIKELVEECQKIVDFFKDHPIHGEKQSDEK